MSRQIVVNTVQGIGDIFWVYQKLAPYFDDLFLNVFCVDPNNVVQRRSEAFCKMLPKVRRVLFRKVRTEDYHKLARGRFSIAAVLRSSGPVNYAVNAPLESGINLRDIDPDSRLEEFVDLGLPGVVDQEDYLCLFVAGLKSVNVWRAERWARLAEKLALRLDTNEIRLIGADWDRSVQEEVAAHLTQHRVTSHIGSGLAETIDIIRRSRYFLGYQSGLNVLADNYDVQQLMIYFDKLAPMLYTWCKPANVKTIFHATTFSSCVDATIDELPLPMYYEA